jgi:hypothetical protein
MVVLTEAGTTKKSSYSFVCLLRTFREREKLQETWERGFSWEKKAQQNFPIPYILFREGIERKRRSAANWGGL